MLKSFKIEPLTRIKDILNRKLISCDLCFNNCNVNRNIVNGLCNSGVKVIVSSYCIHYGEEPVLVGSDELKTKNGVGNIFFGNCNLKCVFCQNYQISQNHLSEANFVVTKESLANIILELQGKNVNSIGFVSPTHFIPQIIEAIELASKKGLNLPLIYNTNCYDSPEIIEYLNGIFDIYLPDFKYSDDKFAKKYSNAKGYFELAKKNILKMYEQVGSELIIEDNILKRGLIIRHLILPNNIAGSYEILKFISGLDKNISISLMSQYYPAYKAKNFDLISRNISESEYNKVLDWMDRLGLENGFVQDFDSKDYYIPDFENRNLPFKR